MPQGWYGNRPGNCLSDRPMKCGDEILPGYDLCEQRSESVADAYIFTKKKIQTCESRFIAELLGYHLICIIFLCIQNYAFSIDWRGIKAGKKLPVNLLSVRAQFCNFSFIVYTTIALRDILPRDGR